MLINVLCVGDVVGKRSCEHFRNVLHGVKSRCQVDLVIVNGENSADGNGITPYSADHLFKSGANIITGGNHTLKRCEVYDMLDTSPFMTVPANLTHEHGKAVAYCDLGHSVVAVINLCGTVYTNVKESAFDAADKAIAEAKQNGCKVIFVDFHAEATSEKRALGLYLDGRVSAVFGTHTHVPTADMQILPGGTGYITDLGMCGPVSSVLGIDRNIIINRFRNISQDKFIVADGNVEMWGCIFTVDTSTGKTVSVTQIRE